MTRRSETSRTLAGFLLGVAVGGFLLAGLAWQLRDTGPWLRTEKQAEQSRLDRLGTCYLSAPTETRLACETKLLAVPTSPERLVLHGVLVPLVVLAVAIALLAPVAASGAYLLFGSRGLSAALLLVALGAGASGLLAWLGVFWEFTLALFLGHSACALSVGARLLLSAGVLHPDRLRISEPDTSRAARSAA